MKKLFFATSNKSKVNRFKEKLLKHGIELISINDIDTKIEVEENGKDAIDNAIIKAKAYKDIVNYPVLAMDDTLYIENLEEDKQPGMYVRRVNGKRLNDEEMIEYYSNLAKEYGKDDKLISKWIYGIALISNDKLKTFTWNKEEFYITSKRHEKIDVGYPLNSISINIKLNKYFVEMTDLDKLEVQEDEEDVINFIVNNI